MKKKTIGILTTSLAFDYVLRSYQGAVRAAKNAGYDTVCFLGAPLDSSYNNEMTANVLYTMPDPATIDGLLINASIIGYLCSKQRMIDFCNSFYPLPVVSLSFDLKGIPSVVVDNYGGMYEAVSHLIEVHHRKKLAFICGPEEHEEARERLAAYKDALTNHGLPLSPSLILPGNYTPKSGSEAIRILLDERKVDISTIDGLICSNDAMASFALYELQKRNIRVPGDIGLISFDNNETSGCLTPALTSVNQPLYKMGKKGIEILTDIMEGKKVPMKHILKTSLVTRRSCGCTENSSLEKRIRHITRPHEVSIKNKRDKKKSVFWRNINKSLNKAEFIGSNVSIWKELLSHLRLKAVHLGYKNDPVIKRFWEQTKEIISMLIKRKFKEDHNSNTLRNIGTKLLVSFDIEKICDNLAEIIPELGVRGFYMSIYKNPGQSYSYPDAYPDKSELILAFNEGKRINLETTRCLYSTGRLLPAGIKEQINGYNFVILDLYFEKKQIGFIIIDTEKTYGVMYETLRLQISCALNGAFLLHKTEEDRITLARANEEISKLNEQLQDENIRLATEMMLADRIQTALLPRNIKHIHPDFEIAAIMQPAGKVGGDYYDVACDRDGILWLCIGDVSGHGVTPGLIMMMTQTVHRALSATVPATPREMVNRINEILFDSINKRLKGDHYMTFTALKYQGDGYFSHAGAHMDIIIYRSRTNNCELITTGGTFLFFVSDISGVTANSEFLLECGDIMFLYTDGLIEARSPDNKYLDLEGLCTLIYNNVGTSKTVEEIRDGILTGVKAWSDNIQRDDMTLLVVRRNS